MLPATSSALSRDRTFAAALTFVFDREGGYVNHPADPGGATNMGITRTTLMEYRGRPASEADLRALTKAEAADIYRKRYWDAVRGDDLPPALAMALMDGGVNCGPARARKWLQAALKVKQDGDIGPVTLAAVRGAPIGPLLAEVMAQRLVHHANLSTFSNFGLGWMRRCAALTILCAAALPLSTETKS